MSPQTLLVEPPDDPADEPPTVWVVASRKMDSPHPSVEGVYDNEEAANAHKRALANDSFSHQVVAWGVFEHPIQSEADL